jgi:hypothetical protein
VGVCGPGAAEAGEAGRPVVGARQRNEARREADGSGRPRIRKERIRVEREGKKGVVVILHFFVYFSIFLELF